ncbi:MAG: HAD family phosphatase [Gammaproteobacteria bacterium]|nr:HAD family phosphatase [Gammaproteobacteria bacterium]
MNQPLAISAAVFDMDGLLIDSERLAMQAFLDTGTQFSLDLPETLYFDILGTNDKHTRQVILSAIGDRVDADIFFKTMDQNYYEIINAAPVPLLPGVSALLDALEERQIPAAVATSTRSEKAIIKLTEVGIYERFQHVVGGDQIANSKPAPDIYLRAASLLNIDPARCLAFEDSPNGVRAAVAAGMQTIQIPNLLQPDDELRTLGHRVYQQIDDVIPLLQG